MKLSGKNILAIIVVVLLVIYGSLKGLIYYKFKNAVDTASAQMRIFATLRYDGISSSLLDSSVTIHKVSILPSGFDDGINIDAITLQTPDISYLLKGINSRRGEFPERINVAMQGFKLDLYGSMIDQFEQTLSQLDAMMQGVTTTACGNKLYLGPAEYREMGYDILDSDLQFGYKFGEQAIEMQLDWTTKDMAAAAMQITMTGPARASASAVMSNPPQLKEITVLYQDLSLTKRTNQYCAKQSNQTVEKYIEAETGKSDTAYALQWGLVPGPGLKQAYKDFLTNPGTVKVTMRPPANFNQATINLYKPEDLPSILNLEVSVNEKPVNDLSFTFQPADASEAEEIASLQDRLSTFKEILQSKDDKPLIQQPTRIKKGPPPRFHQVKIADLNKHIDRQVRVYTNSNQVRRGRLASVTGSAINVTQDVHRGEFTMIIVKAEIKKIEVLYAK